MLTESELDALRALAKRELDARSSCVILPPRLLLRLLEELADLRRREAERGRALLGDGDGSF